LACFLLGLDFNLQDEAGLKEESNKVAPIPVELGEVESATKLKFEDPLELTLSGRSRFKGGEDPLPELELVSSLDPVNSPSRFFFSYSSVA
jgi:hypothetical protein